MISCYCIFFPNISSRLSCNNVLHGIYTVENMLDIFNVLLTTQVPLINKLTFAKQVNLNLLPQIIYCKKHALEHDIILVGAYQLHVYRIDCQKTLEAEEGLPCLYSRRGGRKRSCCAPGKQRRAIWRRRGSRTRYAGHEMRQ